MQQNLFLIFDKSTWWGDCKKIGQKIAAGWAGLAVMAKKAIMRFQFLAYFLEILSTLIFLQFSRWIDMKNVAKCWKDFLWYCTLETYRNSVEITTYYYLAKIRYELGFRHYTLLISISKFWTRSVSTQWVGYGISSLKICSSNLVNLAHVKHKRVAELKPALQ